MQYLAEFVAFAIFGAVLWGLYFIGSAIWCACSKGNKVNGSEDKSKGGDVDA